MRNHATVLILSLMLGACSPSPTVPGENVAAAPPSPSQPSITRANTSHASTPGVAAPPKVNVPPSYAKKHTELLESSKVKAAFATFKADRQKNVDDLIEITEIPAPPFGEETRGKHIAKMFKEAGISDVSIDEVGNVIARRPGIRGGKTIALLAHIDTVFPIETDVTVRKDGDTYIAPGIGDNSRGIVVMLSLIRAMNAHDIQTEADILFIGNIGEEGLGDLRGVKHLYREGAPKIDTMIAIDAGRTDSLVYGAVGSFRYRVTVKGPGGHSWSDFGDANPHHALGRIMTLFAQRAPEVTATGPRTSFSVGRIGGGTSINSIPFESWMEVDMRSVNMNKLREMDAVFKQAVTDGLAAENAARKQGESITVDVQKVGNRPAGVAPLTEPLILDAAAAMQALGITPKLSLSSTDANTPISLGLPAITIGRGGVSKGAHSFEETWTDSNSHEAIELALLVTLAQAGLVKD